MKIILKTSLLIINGLFSIAACNSTDNNLSTKTISQQTIANNRPQKGDNVSNNLVCMVNDAYMGKDQIEVKYEGKTYYGCCEMCEKRIPLEEAVRYAIDPYSLRKVNKADAYIVIINDKDDVAYFENKENFIKYNKKNM